MVGTLYKMLHTYRYHMVGTLYKMLHTYRYHIVGTLLILHPSLILMNNGYIALFMQYRYKLKKLIPGISVVFENKISAWIETCFRCTLFYSSSVKYQICTVINTFTAYSYYRKSTRICRRSWLKRY